jgi:putative membrane protein
MGESLFAMHMVEHELLMAVAAPLLVIGRPMIALLWALPSTGRRAVGAIGSSPPTRRVWLLLTGTVFAWALHTVVLWAWHIPALFESAMRNEALHALQHASFLGAALVYWSSLLGRPHRRAGVAGAGRGAAVLSLFATSMQTGVLGALLTLGSVPWYPAYGDAAAPWGLTPLEDQQLAGLLMWVPGGVAYTGAALALLASWLRDAEAGTRRWEQALAKAGRA